MDIYKAALYKKYKNLLYLLQKYKTLLYLFI